MEDMEFPRYMPPSSPSNRPECYGRPSVGRRRPLIGIITNNEEALGVCRHALRRGVLTIAGTFRYLASRREPGPSSLAGRRSRCSATRQLGYGPRQSYPPTGANPLVWQTIPARHGRADRTFWKPIDSVPDQTADRLRAAGFAQVPPPSKGVRSLE